MSVPYESERPARFTIENVDGYDQIRIPAQRNLFIMLFLAVWLCGWTIGGISALSALLKGFQSFLALWLCGWVFGECFALLTVAWMLGGAEVVRFQGQGLEIRTELFGLGRRKLYRGASIHALKASASGSSSWNNAGRSRSLSLPIVVQNKYGAVSFSYGARTIYLGPGLDEAEGQLIVDRILKRLPRAAD